MEGFSDPSWVLLLAVTSKVGLLGKGNVLGIPQYLIVTKGLAVGLNLIVLASMKIVIDRILVTVTGRRPSAVVANGCWLAAGLLLTANPSYVVWMVSGLENPMLAAVVAGLTAVTVRALPEPNTRAMVALGGLCGLAALTRPDGVVYAIALVVVPLLAVGASLRDRGALLVAGSVVFFAIFLAYLSFRVLYFHAWLPNTAIAKAQGVPTLGSIHLNVSNAQSTWPLWLVSLGGGTIAVRRLRQDRNFAGICVIAGGTSIWRVGRSLLSSHA